MYVKRETIRPEDLGVGDRYMLPGDHCCCVWTVTQRLVDMTSFGRARLSDINGCENGHRHNLEIQLHPTYRVCVVDDVLTKALEDTFS